MVWRIHAIIFHVAFITPSLWCDVRHIQYSAWIVCLHRNGKLEQMTHKRMNWIGVVVLLHFNLVFCCVYTVYSVQSTNCCCFNHRTMKVCGFIFALRHRENEKNWNGHEYRHHCVCITECAGSKLVNNRRNRRERQRKKEKEKMIHT